MAERNLPEPVAKGTRANNTVGLDRKIRSVSSGIGDTLLNDILLPGVMNLLRQAGHGVIDGIFGGGGRSYYSGYSQPSYRYGRTDYSGYSRGNKDHDYDDYGRGSYYGRGKRRNNVDIIFRSWGEAEDVKDALAEVLEANGRVYISDLNYLADQDDRDHMDTEYGWFDVSKAYIRTVRRFFPDGADGYGLILPEPVYIGH